MIVIMYIHKNPLGKTFLQADFVLVFLENKNINGSQVCRILILLHLTALLIYLFFIVTRRDKMGGNKVKVHTKALKQLLLALKNRMG